jgi:hypothetical protein
LGSLGLRELLSRLRKLSDKATARPMPVSVLLRKLEAMRSL